jgi:hypothetical protein
MPSHEMVDPGTCRGVSQFLAFNIWDISIFILFLNSVPTNSPSLVGFLEYASEKIFLFLGVGPR